MFGSVKVPLVRLLLDGGKFEALLLLPLLLDRRLSSRNSVRVLVVLVEAVVAVVHVSAAARTLLIIVLRLAVIPPIVLKDLGDFLSRAFYPIAGRGY
jgi:hypothetical protein